MGIWPLSRIRAFFVGRLVGAITSRAEAQVLRLSALYTVLDCSTLIRPAHLTAALALWDYAEASARRIFGRRLGPPVADVILEGLRTPGPMTETAISAKKALVSLLSHPRHSAWYP